MIGDPYNPDQEHRCWKLLAVWTDTDIANKTVLLLPQSIGIPINRQNDGEEYLLFEITYKNLDHFLGIRDSSGFDVYVYKHNTDIEADIVAVGSVPDYRFFIPPKMKEWVVTGNCYKECLQNVLDLSLNEYFV